MRIRRSSMLYRRDYLNIYILNVGWPAPDPITWNVLPPLAPSAVKSGPDSPGRTRQSSLPSASEYIDDGYFVPAGLLFPVLVFFSPACMRNCFSHVQLCETLRTGQAPLSMEFSSHEDWSGLPCPPPRDPPSPRIIPVSLMSPTLAGWFFTTNAA